MFSFYDKRVILVLKRKIYPSFLTKKRNLFDKIEKKIEKHCDIENIEQFFNILTLKH